MERTEQNYKMTTQLPSSRNRAALMGASDTSADNFVRLIRERERYNWLADKVDRWVGMYNVAELVALLDKPAELPGQHEKALVALSLSDDLSALAALQQFDTSHRTDSFKMLHEVCLGEWHQRNRSGRNRHRVE